MRLKTSKAKDPTGSKKFKKKTNDPQIQTFSGAASTPRPSLFLARLASGIELIREDQRCRVIFFSRTRPEKQTETLRKFHWLIPQSLQVFLSFLLLRVYTVYNFSTACLRSMMMVNSVGDLSFVCQSFTNFTSPPSLGISSLSPAFFWLVCPACQRENWPNEESIGQSVRF